jgi:hypothetical protein
MSDIKRVQIQNILAGAGVTFSAKYLTETTKPATGDAKPWQCDEWAVTFKGTKPATATHHAQPGEVFTTRYFMGPGHRSKPKTKWDAAKPVAPTPADVLYSLTLDATAAHESFADWCGNFGYEEDSRQAFKMYEECCATAKELRRIFTREQLDAIRTTLEDY